MLRRLLGDGRAGRALSLVPLAVATLCAAQLTAQDPPRESRRAAPVTAIRAGTVHPVSGPAIPNGVVLIRGSRILAVGAVGDVEIPEGASVLDYPDGHVYPGLIDAMSSAFAADIASDGNVDAGATVSDALDQFDEPSRELAEEGITTAYVANRSPAMWRGQGALIRLRPSGFTAFPEMPTAGVHLRLTTGPGPGHPLQRIKQLAAFGREFEQLEAYEKAFEEHQKKLEEYEKKFAEYLEWHSKRAGENKPAEEAKEGEPTAEPPAQSGERRAPGGERRGSRRGSRGGTPPGETPRPGGPPGAGERGQGGEAQGAETAKPAEGAAANPQDKAPERPKFPPEPKRDPAKDALIQVRDGGFALFVEAHRPDEVARALELAREHELKRVVIEFATGGIEAVDRIAAAGLPVIVDTALPPRASGRVPDGANYVPEHVEARSLAAALARADVPFALGSGSVQRARHLPSLVAEAIGQGVPADVAIRAVTLTPARILGIADRVGSLEPRKLADVVVTSAPLESSDARVLRVISAGTTVHEAR